jgi:lysophospholipase L1-like esterase
MVRRIMCYGDSLTWGWKPDPDSALVERYARHERWTGVLAAELGTGFEIIEEGLSGRTTNLDDPTDQRLNGAAYLPAALASHLPLDLVVIMLGTNDTKSYFNRSAFDIAVGASILIGQVAQSAGGVGTIYPAPKTLLMSPPPLADMPRDWISALCRSRFSMPATSSVPTASTGYTSPRKTIPSWVWR